MNTLAIQALLEKRQNLVNERDFTIDRLNTEIGSIETAIEQLSGKKVWETENGEAFDDEHKDYIRSSIEN